MYKEEQYVGKTEEELAFILGHEMAHALLDHSRTQASARKTKID